MALVVKDRVQETTTTTGQGTITLAGAVAGFQSFAAIGNSNTTYYTIAGATQWEIGIGTYTSSGTTLSRDTVLSNSLGDTTKIDFSAGTKNVFCTYPSEVSVYSSNNAGTSGQVLKSNGTGVASSWSTLPTYLPILTNGGSTVDVAVANGYIPVLTNGGSTVNVTVS